MLSCIETVCVSVTAIHCVPTEPAILNWDVLIGLCFSFRALSGRHGMCFDNHLQITRLWCVGVFSNTWSKWISKSCVAAISLIGWPVFCTGPLYGDYPVLTLLCVVSRARCLRHVVWPCSRQAECCEEGTGSHSFTPLSTKGSIVIRLLKWHTTISQCHLRVYFQS